VAMLLDIQQLSKSFMTPAGEVPVLHAIDLSVADGESLAIVGPSGSGKSTLLSLIGLLEQPSHGRYLLRGQDVSLLTPHQLRQLRNRHLGWVFQNFNLLSDLTAWENVALPLKFDRTVSRSSYRQRATEALASVGLEHKVLNYPSELSGGQQQRVAIARALVSGPGLLLADEPTGNLDSAASQQVVDLLLQRARAGAAVIIVTHDAEVAKQCERCLTLKDGRIVHAS